MKNYLLTLFIAYGIGVSSISMYWGSRDLRQLNEAVIQNAQNAELRHRINVFADGTWFLIGNLIVLIALSSINISSNNRPS